MKVYSVGQKSAERMKQLKGTQKNDFGSYAFLVVIAASAGLWLYENFVPAKTTTGVITQEVHWSPGVFDKKHEHEGSYAVKVDTEQVKNVTSRFVFFPSAVKFKEGNCVVGQLSTTRILQRHRMDNMKVVPCPSKGLKM